MDILIEIERLIDNYEKSVGSQNLSGLLELRDRLAVNSYRLAQQVAEYKKEYNFAYFTRKISVAKSTQGMLAASKMPMNKATMEATIKNEEIYLQEQELEAAAYQMDLLLRQVNKVLEALSQRISHLKTEKENTRYGST